MEKCLRDFRFNLWIIWIILNFQGYISGIECEWVVALVSEQRCCGPISGKSLVKERKKNILNLLCKLIKLIDPHSYVGFCAVRVSVTLLC